MTEPFLTVTYTGEPDIVFEFAKEGDSRLFGRDDTSCDIVIWSALNGRELSRVAGRIWRMEGELWLRNLSTTHELHLRIPHMPPEQPLRRRRDELARGDARSIPRPVCTVLGPDGCELQVLQVNQPEPEMLAYGPDNPTLSRVPEVPSHLRHIAAALCEPLLAGGYLPASYREVMSRIGEPSLKKVRMLVGELCTHYTDASPELKDRLLVRLVREQEQLGIPADPQLRRGLWTFGQARAGTTEVRGAAEGNRRRALALPDYYEVAQILVSHFRITAADVERLPAEKFRDD